MTIEPDRDVPTHHRRRLRPAALLLGLALPAAAVAAESSQDIYLSVGENGELSFSDVAAPDAQRIVVDTAPALEDPLAELDRRIEQTLTVAEALEASRLAREQARAEARARAAAERPPAVPEVVVEERYVTSPFLFPPRPHRRPDPRDPRGEPEPPATVPPPPGRSRAFPAPD